MLVRSSSVRNLRHLRRGGGARSANAGVGFGPVSRRPRRPRRFTSDTARALAGARRPRGLRRHRRGTVQRVGARHTGGRPLTRGTRQTARGFPRVAGIESRAGKDVERATGGHDVRVREVWSGYSGRARAKLCGAGGGARALLAAAARSLSQLGRGSLGTVSTARCGADGPFRAPRRRRAFSIIST